ncbi:hypothetical protein G6F31_018132 [Rhizopus arrhizus]|nr:hypothetical protein G6F31_018132 [Rhizopus arrhizus]
MIDDLLHPPIAVAEFKVRFHLRKRNAALFQRCDQALQLCTDRLFARFTPHAPGRQELLVVAPAGNDRLDAFQRAVGIRATRQGLSGLCPRVDVGKPVLQGAPCIAVIQQPLAQRRARLQKGAVLAHQRLQPGAQIGRRGGITRDPRDGIGKALRPLLVALNLIPIRQQARGLRG